MTNKINLDTFAGKIVFSVVRIESMKEGAIEPATGFIVQEKINTEVSVPIIITNKHVIENADKIAFYFIKSDGKEPSLGKGIRIYLENPKEHFINHPDEGVDLTALPIASLLNGLKTKTKDFPFYIPIPNTPIIATKEDLSKFDAIEDIIFIGYPDGKYDKSNLTPIVRRGITATPISLLFDGKPSFLIDSTIFTGSSGSPVFVYNNGLVPDGRGNFSVGMRLVFVGVISAFHNSVEYLDGGDKAISTPLNLGEVISSDKVKELIQLIVDKGKNQLPSSDT
jgi:hypothetical protein